MKKTLIILSAWTALGVLSSIFSSCDPCHGDGPIIIKLDSLISELKIIKEYPLNDTTKYHKAYYTIDNYAPNDKGIRYDSVGITVKTINKITLIQTEIFSNAAYACSPNEIYDKLSAVKITSSADYNNNYPRGTDLQELMSVHTFYMVRGKSIASLSQNDSFGELLYTFNVPPSENRYHDITIHYMLADGRTVESTIQNVLIKK